MNTDSLNSQINAELASAYLYLSMAAWFDAQGLPGFAHWMKVQAQEEQAHAMKFYDHIIERGGSVRLQAIDGPPVDFNSVLEIAEAVLEHEKKVTGLIHNLVEEAQKEKDHALESFLRWFVDEQVEEEASAQELVDKVKRVGEKGHALYLLDKDLGKRGAE